MKGADFNKKSFTPFIGADKNADTSKRSDWPMNDNSLNIDNKLRSNKLNNDLDIEKWIKEDATDAGNKTSNR